MWGECAAYSRFRDFVTHTALPHTHSSFRDGCRLCKYFVYASISFMQVFRWSSDQLGCRLNDLGKVRRAQMEFGGGSSTHWHSRQNIQFYLLEIVMFITQTSSISPVSCPKPTPLYSTQKARKHIKSPTRGIVRRYILTTLSSISLVVGPARLSAQ